MSECEGEYCKVQHRNRSCGARRLAERLREKAILEASACVNKAKDALDGALIDLRAVLESKKP